MEDNFSINNISRRKYTYYVEKWYMYSNKQIVVRSKQNLYEWTLKDNRFGMFKFWIELN